MDMRPFAFVGMTFQTLGGISLRIQWHRVLLGRNWDGSNCQHNQTKNGPLHLTTPNDRG
jgi:hypothetical protein